MDARSIAKSRCGPLALISLAACAGCTTTAYARSIHGFIAAASTLPAQTISFGSLTPEGYGGSDAGSTGGALTLVSTTCTAAGYNELAVDGNGMLVPTGYTDHVYLSTHYGREGSLNAETPGSTPATCSVNLQNAHGDTATDPVVITPNTYTIRGMYGMAENAESTSKPFGQNTSPAYFYNNTGFQFGNLFAATQTADPTLYPHLTLGQTIICRDSQLNPTGASLGLSAKIPVPNSGTQYWPGTGRIVVKSEHAYTLLDPYGTSYQSGGCQMAQVSLAANSTNVDYSIPFDFQNIRFFENPTAPSAVASTAALLSLGSGGATVTNSYVGVGDNVLNPDVPGNGTTGIIGINFTFSSLSTGLPTGTLIETASNDYFYHAALSSAASGVAYSFTGNAPSLTAQGNTFNRPYEKAIQVSGRGGHTITDNTIFGIRPTLDQHPDNIIVSSTCVYASSTDCSHRTNDSYLGTLTEARNIVVHGPVEYAYPTLTYTAGGSGPVSPADGTYSGSAANCVGTGNCFEEYPVGTGAGRGGWLDLTVSNCSTSCVYSAVPHNNAPNGFGYLPGDVVSILYAGGTVYFTVGGTAAQITGDGFGLVQLPNNNGEGPSTWNMYDNIIEVASGESITLSSYATANINNNDALMDFHASQNNNQVGWLWCLGSNSSTCNADNNVANAFTFGTAAVTVPVPEPQEFGTFSCAPGTVGITSPGGSTTCGGLVARGPSTSSPYLDSQYTAIWPNWNPTVITQFNRASYIAQHEPVAGTVNTALCPRDNAGVLYWHVPGAACDMTATHTPAQ